MSGSINYLAEEDGGFHESLGGLDQVLASPSSSKSSLGLVPGTIGPTMTPPANPILLNNPWDAKPFQEPLDASLPSLAPLPSQEHTFSPQFGGFETATNIMPPHAVFPSNNTTETSSLITQSQLTYSPPSSQPPAPIGLDRPLDPWASSSPNNHNINTSTGSQSQESQIIGSSSATDLFDSKNVANNQQALKSNPSPVRSNPNSGSPRRRVHYGKSQDMIRVLPGDWTSPKDTIEVQICAQKVGFVFKHRNYTVTSSVHGATVTRRYSDFVWLQEVLLKRYPFRVIPDLPPKQALGVGGDDNFIEKRQRGLQRFLAFIANHPILRKDDLDISNYRNTTSIVVDEEFSHLQLSEEMMASVPENVSERVSAFVRQSKDLLDELDNTIQFIENISEAYASAGSYFMKHSISLSKMTEHLDCIFPECINCPAINNSFSQMSEVFQNMSGHYLAHKLRMRHGFLEDLKIMRDFIGGLQQMYHRAEKVLNTLMITSSTNRINANQSKLSQMDYNSNRSEYERLLRIIDHDRRELEYEQARSEFIYFCLWSELAYYHYRKANIASIYRYYFEDQLDQEKSLVHIWERLFPIVAEIPTSGF